MKRKAKIEIFQNEYYQWFWRLRAANGYIVADGAEAYVSPSNAKRAALKSMRLMMRAAVELVKS
jgi:uncharacterized protein YegP (UPF0339 family)